MKFIPYQLDLNQASPGFATYGLHLFLTRINCFTYSHAKLRLSYTVSLQVG